jgi:hypothetical protein
MKPPPVLDQPVDKTFSIADLHFTDITSRYGPTVSVLIVYWSTLMIDYRQLV